MEDWVSPWADENDDDWKLHDGVGTTRSKVKIVEEEGVEVEVEAVPVTEAKKGGGIVVDWDGGFADSSAWASATPVVQVGDGDGDGDGGGEEVFGWGALPADDFAAGAGVGVGAMENGSGSDNKEVEEEDGGIEDDWRGGDSDDDRGLHPISTDEVNAWGAGSGWEDPKSSQTPGPIIDRKGDVLELSLGGVGGALDRGEFDTGVKDLPVVDIAKHVQLVDAANLFLESPTKGRAKGEKETSNDHLQAVPEAVSDPAPSGIREGSKGSSTPPPEISPVTSSIHEVKRSTEDETSAPTSDQNNEDDDDFGDFAAEGEKFEEAQSPIPELVPSPGIKAPPPDSFKIDISLVSKIYPIPTSRPEPPPIEEIISTTESRKAWYRLSTSETIRKGRGDDDDYVRVMWVGSKVQEDVNKIVEKWMTEDRNLGGVGFIGGGQRVSAMFGWGDSDSGTSSAPQLPNGRNSLKTSGSGFGSISTPGSPIFSKPTSVKIPSSADLVGGGSVSSPQTACFEWSSAQLQSGPVKGEEKAPSTPLRSSFNSSTRHSLSSQPTPPEISTAPHSMTVPSTTISPAIPSTAGIKTSPTVLTPEFAPVVGNSIAADPLPVGLPVDVQATGLASAPGFDDWGTFGDMSVHAPPASVATQSRNYDEWGAFEGLEMSRSSSSVHQEPHPVIGPQGPLVATNLDSAARMPIPSVQFSPESNKQLNSAQTAPGEADTTTDDWGDLESLSSQPPKYQKPSDVSSSHVPENQNLNSLGWPESKDQKTPQWGLFEGSPEDSKSSIQPTATVFDGSGLFSTITNGSMFSGVRKNPLIPSVQTQQDDDDWGEMVQSPTESTSVLKALRMPVTTSSQDITSSSGSTPLVPSIPQRMPTLDIAPMPSSAPAMATETTLAPSATPGEFGLKSGSSIGDSWDLSFFEGPPTPNSGFSMPKAAPEPISQDLWDTPAVVQGTALESADDRAIREIVEGLPDLSYMLG